MASIVKILRVLADPNRLRILLLLGSEELSVAELQEILVMGQSTISTHLSQLKQAGLVEDRRTGKSNLYRLLKQDSIVAGLLAQARHEIPEAANDQAAMRRVLKKRQDKMRAFFDSVAGRLGKDYVPGKSWKGLAEALLRLMPPMVIADLGAGEGAFALLLAERAKKVIAVDSSAKMIEVGREQALRHGIENVEFRLGDMEEVPIDDAEVDLVFFSQSLHHALHPDRAVSEANRILVPAAASSFSISPSTALKRRANSTPTSGSASARRSLKPCSKRQASPRSKPRSSTKSPRLRSSRPCWSSQTNRHDRPLRYHCIQQERRP